MPRRHPKDDDKTTGPSPQVLAERRERRQERRARKSPDLGVGSGLLTSKERMILSLEHSSIKSQLKQTKDQASKRILQAQMNSLSRELTLDKQLKERRPVDVLRSSAAA